MNPASRRLRKRPEQTPNSPSLRPTLRFTPCAWAKWIFLRNRGPTEIGGFGISAPDDLLLVEDLVLVSQVTTAVSVVFDDEAVADFFEEQIDLGRRPEQFGRIWLHTHPGSCPLPSQTDEETFARAFGRCDWAVMGILACSGATYARLRGRCVLPLETELAVSVDYGREFPASDHAAWQAEYDRSVTADDGDDLTQKWRRELRHLAGANTPYEEQIEEFEPNHWERSVDDYEPL